MKINHNQIIVTCTYSPHFVHHCYRGLMEMSVNISFLSTTCTDTRWLIVPSYRCSVKQYSHPVPSNCGNPAMLTSVPALVIAFPRIQFCCWYGHWQENMSQSQYLSNVASFSFICLCFVYI